MVVADEKFHLLLGFAALEFVGIAMAVNIFVFKGVFIVVAGSANLMLRVVVTFIVNLIVTHVSLFIFIVAAENDEVLDLVALLVDLRASNLSLDDVFGNYLVADCISSLNHILVVALGAS